MSMRQNSPSVEDRSCQRTIPIGRLGWLVALFAIQWLYFPINRTVVGGVVLSTPLDAWFPLRPVWVIPYLLSLVWWAACFVWAACKMEDSLYRAFALGLIAVMLSSYAVYVVYPTYVVRPSPQGNDLLTRAIQILYQDDRANNAFPSGHTYNTVMIALFWWRWHPRQRWLWFAITTVVLLSTLFTRQHNLPDLAGGIAFAWLGYRFGLWWVGRRTRDT
jgi:membrane-associated phospholipid phosphatase